MEKAALSACFVFVTRCKTWSFGARRTVAALLPSWLLYPMTLQVILVLRETGHCVDLQIRGGHSHTAERLCFITNLCLEIEDLNRKRDLQAEKQQVQTMHVDKMSALTTVSLSIKVE